MVDSGEQPVSQHFINFAPKTGNSKSSYHHQTNGNADWNVKRLLKEIRNTQRVGIWRYWMLDFVLKMYESF